jgi:hypothetical protein
MFEKEKSQWFQDTTESTADSFYPEQRKNQPRQNRKRFKMPDLSLLAAESSRAA